MSSPDLILAVLVLTIANLIVMMLIWRDIDASLAALMHDIECMRKSRGHGMISEAAPSRRPIGADPGTAAGNGTGARRASWRG